MVKNSPIISDKSVDKIGEFQKDIGELSSDLSLFNSYIFLIFCIIFGVGLLIYGIMLKDTENKWIFIGVSIFFIIIGILTVIYNKYINNIVHKNKSAAQLYGTMSEISMIKNTISPNKKGNRHHRLHLRKR